MLPRLPCVSLSYLLLSLLEISFLHDVENMDPQAVLLSHPERVLSPRFIVKSRGRTVIGSGSQ